MPKELEAQKARDANKRNKTTTHAYRKESPDKDRKRTSRGRVQDRAPTQIQANHTGVAKTEW